MEDEFFGRKVNTHLHNEAHARGSVLRLREAIKKFTQLNPDEDFTCTLEEGSYALSVGRRHKRPTEFLWRDHLRDSRPPNVITGAHLFFFDCNTHEIFRRYDFNDDSQSSVELVARMKERHPELNGRKLEPWRDFYHAAGEVHAWEAIQRWFHAEKGILVSRSISRDITDREALDSSPILVGRPQTNRFIARWLHPDHAPQLRYRIHSRRGALQIDYATEEERAALTDYSLSKDGVLGPAEDFDTVFGVFTRMPSPSGRGPVSAIASAYYPVVSERIAQVMTNNDDAERIIHKMNLRTDQPIPECFELLFAVDRAAGGGESAGFPKLLCCNIIG